MTEKPECQGISLFLAGYVNNRLKEDEMIEIGKHLKVCRECRTTAEALRLAVQASDRSQSDLWPVLRTRLAEAEENDLVKLIFPPFRWQDAVLLGVVVLTLVTVPNPLGLLVAIGLL